MDTLKVTQTVVALNVGDYTPTLVDQRKANADILVTAANGGSFTIKVQTAIDFSNKGVTDHYDNGCMEVTSKKLETLRSMFKVETDF